MYVCGAGGVGCGQTLLYTENVIFDFWFSRRFLFCFFDDGLNYFPN